MTGAPPRSECAPDARRFIDMKQRGEKIVALTAYDAPTARILFEVGVDVIIVGDSVGVNMLGYAHEREVTLADMAHHIAAVRRGAPHAYVMGDLPYAAYDTPTQARASARALRDAGADCVKFEGAGPAVAEAIVSAGVAVCGHLGLESQHHAEKRRQGRTAEAARRLLDDSRALDAAGQAFLVLKLVPAEVAARISAAVRAPTIGIGAGAATDGQVLVVNDMAGITARDFKHSRRYGEIGAALRAAVAAYVKDVRAGAFPTQAHAFHMAPEERAIFERERM